MCLDSAYYDTSVFLQSLNSEHDEHEASKRLLDARRITWSVGICVELSSAESTAAEYIEKFEVECASSGINFIRVSNEESRRVSRRHVPLKRKLSECGFAGRDWLHLMSAVVCGSRALCTTDLDFWDPSNKANPKARKRKVFVQRQIEDSLPIKILLPSEAIALPCC